MKQIEKTELLKILETRQRMHNQLCLAAADLSSAAKKLAECCQWADYLLDKLIDSAIPVDIEEKKEKE